MTERGDVPGPISRSHRMPFGAEIQPGGEVRFSIFAPSAASVKLAIDGVADAIAMLATSSGWHHLTSSGAVAGSRYRFVLPDGRRVADPASRHQPDGVHGPSEVIDPCAYLWNDRAWSGRPWAEAVLYELHVGAFTEAGTFQSAIEKLDHIARLGITAIEVMALAEFAGARNWGYDGVLFYAPHSSYGRPEDLKAFIDAAHARGLMVILDVVYNHFGPIGNDMPAYFPEVLTSSHSTPWGLALNFDGEGSEQVREFIIHNALYWIEEFHVDGLRLDAAHAMMDGGPRHILDELADRVHALAGNRPVHLILENEQNCAARLLRDDLGRPTLYTAQWNHDITHLLGASMAARGAVRPATDGGETDRLGKALAEGFVIAAEELGTGGKPGQAACPPVPPTAYTSFLQTHDLVGNRIFGDRIHAIAAPEAVRAVASIYLLLPQIPLIFMGEEWAASSPFPFFCDYKGDLADAVRKGRLEQLAKQEPKPDPEVLKRAPDPQAEATFRSAKLHWDEIADEPHAVSMDLYRRLLETRRASILPLLGELTKNCGTYKVLGPGALAAQWTLAGERVLRLDANLAWQPMRGFREVDGSEIWGEGLTAGPDQLGPWCVRWSVTEAVK